MVPGFGRRPERGARIALGRVDFIGQAGRDEWKRRRSRTVEGFRAFGVAYLLGVERVGRLLFGVHRLKSVLLLPRICAEVGE